MFQTLLSQLKQYKKATIATPLLGSIDGNHDSGGHGFYYR